MKFYDDSLDDSLVSERSESFGGGFDAFTRSTLLPPDGYQYGENVIIPDNLEVRTRPGADRVATNLGAKIQGVVYFDTPSYHQLLTAANGAVKYTGSTLAAWTAISSYALVDADVAFSAAQGVDKLLITDGTHFYQWDGAALTNFTETPTDPPTGATILLFHNGRMWAAGFPGGTAGKEDDALTASALLDFGVGKWDLTDRSLRIGGGEGDPIVGLCEIPASVPGQKVLGVLKRNSIHLIRDDPTQPFTAMRDELAPESLGDGIGVVGKRAFAVHANDLYFVSPDKSFRTLSRMEAAAAQYRVGDPPLSRPLQPYIDRINWTYANLSAVTGFKSFVFFAVPLDAATHPDTTFVYSVTLQRWVGIITGWTPNSWEVTRFGGVTRLMHGDNDGNVRQWKDYADQTDDATYLDDGTAIATKFWPRSNLFGEPLNDKDLYHYEARFGSSNAVVTFTLLGDGNVLKTWTGDMRPQGPNLEIDLEFDLSNPTNTPTRKGLRGLAPSNEAFVKIESTAGWWSLKSISLTAFLNTLASQ